MRYNKEQILNDIEKLYALIETAYDLAGNLRDDFSGIKNVGANEQHLKNYCNTFRNKIYELRTLQFAFVNDARQIQEGGSND